MDPRPDGPIDWDTLLGMETEPVVEGRRLEAIEDRPRRGAELSEQEKFLSPVVPIEGLTQVSTILPNLDMGGNFVDYGDYDLVVSAEAYPNPARVMGYKGIFIHLPLEDRDGEFNEDAVQMVGGIVAVSREAGKRVLVHCTAGLNRSGLIVATALMASGMSADKAIELIRLRRDTWALCNESFCTWLHGLREPA